MGTVLLLLLAPLAGMAAFGAPAVQVGDEALLTTFQQMPDLPNSIGVAGPVVGVAGEVLVVAGGANFPVPLVDGGPKVWHDAVYLLFPGESQWRTGARLPAPVGYAACATTRVGIVVAGGSDSERIRAEVTLLTVDPTTGELSVSALPDLPDASAFGAAEVIEGRVYVLAAQRSKDPTDVVSALWSLDPAAPSDGWKIHDLPPFEPRSKMVTAVQAGPSGDLELFLFSGSQTTQRADGGLDFRALSDGWRFVPAEDRWYRIADLPVLDDPRPLAGKERFAELPWGIAAGAAEGYGDRQILTFSGSTARWIQDESGAMVPADERPNFVPRVLAYDTAADSWELVGTMPTAVVTTHAVTWNGSIVIPSGEVRPGIRTPEVQSIPAADQVAQALFRPLDYFVLGLYLTAMVGIGVWFARRETSTDEFFLAGRKIPWWAAGLSIFGTQLSAITFMAIPATSFGTDWRRFAGQLMVLPVLVLVVQCLLPLFRRLNVTTAYEYLEARFSVVVRVMASSLFILFQLGRMGIVLLLPAIALSAVTGMDATLCIVLMGILATAYTALGGISAVIWTDVLQVVVLVGGAILCLVVTISDVGGVGPMMDAAVAADKFHMFDWRWDPTEMVAWVLLVGFLFTNLVPYATDQTVVQRYLTTRNEREAAKSLWLNLAMALPAGMLFFGLGTALFVFYGAHPLERALLPESADQLVPWFVVTHLPAGVAGVVVAGIFAAAMSSLDSSMNSITTAIVNDFVERFRDGEIKRDYLPLARRLTVLLGVIGTSAAILLAKVEIRFLFDFFQQVIGLLGGGLAGVFLMGMFCSGANSKGAAIGLISGGITTLAVAQLTEIHFLLYAPIGSLTCLFVGLLVSRLSGGETRDLAGLTYATRGRREQ